MSVSVGNIRFYTGPHDVGGPDDLEQVVVGFIDSTEKRLEIAVQELDSLPIAEAIIRARRRVRWFFQCIAPEAVWLDTPSKTALTSPSGEQADGGVVIYVPDLTAPVSPDNGRS